MINCDGNLSEKNNRTLESDTTLDYYNKNTKKFVIGIVAVDFRTV